ncbi:transcriptional regulator%2C y4mF family [uncultured Ruminococcus sp.]|nr:transcriptional regulator%2C y4mF family [uncultured Ruminococcus sp.]
MGISESILKLRESYCLSQEKLAELIGVSRQTVQKWESGASLPEIDRLIKISNCFGLSLDALIKHNGRRVTEELASHNKIFPNYGSLPAWEAYSSGLTVEYRQSYEEGLDVGSLEGLFQETARLPCSAEKEEIADILFRLAVNAPVRSDYPYTEPSDLEQIKLLRDGYETGQKSVALNPQQLQSKVQGAWMGRICGCLLGKPIEGIRTNELHSLLKASGNFPMRRYILSTDITAEMLQQFNFPLSGRCYADTVERAPVDDDTNYTVLAQAIIERSGLHFTPQDVANAWLDLQGKNAYCTAERVAYCNLIRGYTPPASAKYKNPYREWIGAQIRGDYYGYIHPGRPESAAEMAWRDASISHIKNGIYGEMFVAAMLAQAAVSTDLEDILRTGVSQIPSTSRLYRAVYSVLEGFHAGISEKVCFDHIHRIYDEHSPHDWCHTLSNAMIVASALLYGSGDFGKSICLAVQTGFDTDCNGATVGSVLGMRNGIEQIGCEWTVPVHHQLETSIFGVGTVELSILVDKTLEHIRQAAEANILETKRQKKTE